MEQIVPVAGCIIGFNGEHHLVVIRDTGSALPPIDTNFFDVDAIKVGMMGHALGNLHEFASWHETRKRFVQRVVNRKKLCGCFGDVVCVLCAERNKAIAFFDEGKNPPPSTVEFSDAVGEEMQKLFVKEDACNIER